jgi:hypothetical protein
MPGNDGPYAGLPNKVVEAANGASYAYRDTGGEGEVPLVLLQHFRGNLDNWDPTWATREAQYDAVCAWGVLPARGPDPAGPGEDLPRLGARVPVPAPRRVRRRRRGFLSDPR